MHEKPINDVGKYFRFINEENWWSGSIVKCVLPGKYKLIERLFVYDGKPISNRENLPSHQRREIISYFFDGNKLINSWSRSFLKEVCIACLKEDCLTLRMER